jgi:Holliday junction resolvase RusA-like endonuclease
MSRLYFTIIPGPPVAQGRARLSRSGHHVMHPASREWRTRAVAHIRSELGHRWTPLHELLAVDIIVSLPRPKTRPALVERDAWRAGGAVAAASKGDADNYAKAALDALVDAEVMTDDHLVSTLTVRKLYHGVSGVPFVAIEVRADFAWTE